MINNTMSKEKKKEYYCTECGEQMFDFLCEAEIIKIWCDDGGLGLTYRLDSPYNKKGERNYATIYQCPHYKKRFFWGRNHHDILGFYKEEEIYPDNL